MMQLLSEEASHFGAAMMKKASKVSFARFWQVF